MDGESTINKDILNRPTNDISDVITGEVSAYPSPEEKMDIEKKCFQQMRMEELIEARKQNNPTASFNKKKVSSQIKGANITKAPRRRGG